MDQWVLTRVRAGVAKHPDSDNAEKKFSTASEGVGEGPVGDQDAGAYSQRPETHQSEDRIRGKETLKSWLTMREITFNEFNPLEGLGNQLVEITKLGNKSLRELFPKNRLLNSLSIGEGMRFLQVYLKEVLTYVGNSLTHDLSQEIENDLEKIKRRDLKEIPPPRKRVKQMTLEGEDALKRSKETSSTSQIGRENTISTDPTNLGRNQVGEDFEVFGFSEFLSSVRRKREISPDLNIKMTISKKSSKSKKGPQDGKARDKSNDLSREESPKEKPFIKKFNSSSSSQLPPQREHQSEQQVDSPPETEKKETSLNAPSKKENLSEDLERDSLEPQKDLKKTLLLRPGGKRLLGTLRVKRLQSFLKRK